MASIIPPTRGVAFTLPFFVLNSSGKLVTGATFGTVKRSLDNAAPATATNVPVEVGFGEYSLPLTNAEMAADGIGVSIPVTTANCQDVLIYIFTTARRVDDLSFPAVPGRSLAVDAAGTVSLGVTGLDAIPLTAPAGPAATFPQAISQLWRRFFKKATLTSTQLKTYAADDTTVLTTQTISNDGVTETAGDAT